MILLDREMQTKKITTDKGQTALCCQASFNSDGVITLRNYNVEDKSSDEIIILSAEETQAIISLFRKLARNGFNEPLPY